MIPVIQWLTGGLLEKDPDSHSISRDQSTHSLERTSINRAIRTSPDHYTLNIALLVGSASYTLTARYDPHRHKQSN
jgi:hypothetical protein